MSNAPGPVAEMSPPAPYFPVSFPQSVSADPWVQALFNFSETAADRVRSHRLLPAPTPSTARVVGDAMPRYSLADAAPQLANPLAPLRDRDRQALTEIFTHEHMVAIEADILTRLSYLVPEPPWDVEPYEFLRDFL